jgi:hypothetical protein
MHVFGYFTQFTYNSADLGIEQLLLLLHTWEPHCPARPFRELVDIKFFAGILTEIPSTQGGLQGKQITE